MYNAKKKHVSLKNKPFIVPRPIPRRAPELALPNPNPDGAACSENQTLLSHTVINTANQAKNKYKHSLTFHVRRYVVIAMKPTHRLQTAQLCTTRGHPYHSPKLHLGLCSSMGMWQGTDKHTDG